jgi:hypothetical protein
MSKAMAGPAATGLPDPQVGRWVASRKAAVLNAIERGEISRAEACVRYRISEAELSLWERAMRIAGAPGLRVTRVQVYRPLFDGTVAK